MGAILWFIAALVFAGLELAVGEFTMLMLAGGALAAAGVSLAGAPLWGSAIAFVITAVGLIFFLRPFLHRRLRKPKALDTSPAALVGQSAEVLEAIEGSAGQVRLDGSIWSARSLDPTHTFVPGERVTVVSIDGPTAVVWKES